MSKFFFLPTDFTFVALPPIYTFFFLFIFMVIKLLLLLTVLILRMFSLAGLFFMLTIHMGI